MFGLFSMSTLALIALYGLGFVQMFKGAMNAQKGFMASALWAATWPVSLWKVMNDLWNAPPPAE
jgi:hypothetical protein